MYNQQTKIRKKRYAIELFDLTEFSVKTFVAGVLGETTTAVTIDYGQSVAVTNNDSHKKFIDSHKI